MIRLLKILSVIIITIFSSFLSEAQRLKFTTDTAYLRELNLYLQKSYKKELTEQAYLVFFNQWNSGKLTLEQKSLIIQLSNNLLKKRANAYPHFYDFMNLYISIINSDKQSSNITKWTKAFEFYSRQRNFNNSKIDRLFKSVNYFIDSMTFYETRAVKWAYDNENFQLKFNESEGLRIEFDKTNLICYAKRDSLIVRNTNGFYLPTKNLWVGKGGKISWERANYSPDSVFVKLSEYRAILTKPEITADSVEFTNKHYLKGTLLGRLDEKIIANATGDKASYPRFESYEQRIDLPQIVPDIDFTGGFLMQGARFLGKGDEGQKAILYFHKDKELIGRAESEMFLFSRNRIFSQKADVSLMLGEDSLYSTAIDLNYIIKDQKLLLTSDRRDEIGSLFIDSYHDLDIEIQHVSFSLQDSIIYFKPPPATVYSKAIFRSYNFYSDDEYARLGLMDNVHPLEAINSMVKKGMFIFGPIQLANYLEKDVKYTRRLMIILAKKGFIQYNRSAQVAYAEQKLFDYVQSKFRTKDYDQIEIVSEPPKGNNAILNLNDMIMTIYGVKPFALSNNRRVGIIAKNGEIRVKEDMEIDFDGKLQAGLARLYGEGLTFNYDDFIVDLDQIDSLKLIYQSEDKNEDSLYEYAPVLSVIENVTGTLQIDDSENKAGNITYPNYPIFESLDTSYVFYDHNNEQDTVYDRNKVSFMNYPFVIDSLNSITKKNVIIKGMFTSGGIFPDIEENLTVQGDSSLGFVHELDSTGMELYNGLAVYDNTITLNNKGIKGDGKIHYLNAHVYSEDFVFFPDSMNTYANKFELDILNSDSVNVEYPDVYGDSTYVHWEPNRDQMFISSTNTSLKMFKEQAEFEGEIKLNPNNLKGKGDMSFKNASLKSNSYTFYAEKFTADTSDFNLKPIEVAESPFLTYNVNANVDFENKIGLFKSNGDSSYIDFPVNRYKCYMNYYTWYMGVDLIDVGTLERFKTDSLIADIGTLDSLTNQYKSDLLQDYQVSLSDTGYTAEELLASSEFISTHPGQDSLRFIARSSSYDIKNHVITAKGVKMIKVADAHIYPSSALIIHKNAKIGTLYNVRIVANTTSRHHKFYSSTVDIFGAKKYIGSGDYEYLDSQEKMSLIHFDEIRVDKELQTLAYGKIKEKDHFKFSPEFSYFGKVKISANNKLLNFDGYTKIGHECDHRISSFWLGFKADIKPDSIVIPIPETPKDKESRKLYTGFFQTMDSIGIYPTFLTSRNKFSDRQIFKAGGRIYYNEDKEYFEITDSAKLANPELEGNYLGMHKKLCIALGEGNIDFALNLGHVKLNSAGKLRYNMESRNLAMNIMLGVDFYFHTGALNFMADKLNQAYELEAVDASKTRFQTALKELVGLEKSKSLMNDMSLTGNFTERPPEMEKAIFFTDVEMVWDQPSGTYRSKGPIGIGTINKNPINKRVNGIIELAPKRSGDIISIYIPINGKDWFFFSYTRGTMKSVSSFDDFNDYIVDLKDKERKPPVKDSENPYMFFPASQRVKDNFLTQIVNSMIKKEQGDFNEDITTSNDEEVEEESEQEIFEEETEETNVEEEVILEEVEETGEEITTEEETELEEQLEESIEEENLEKTEEELLEEEVEETGEEITTEEETELEEQLEETTEEENLKETEEDLLEEEVEETGEEITTEEETELEEQLEETTEEENLKETEEDLLEEEVEETGEEITTEEETELEEQLEETTKEENLKETEEDLLEEEVEEITTEEETESVEQLEETTEEEN
ncbi:MAG: hypothetical protein ABFS35_18505, partial [Bacteroidota bacterium]